MKTIPVEVSARHIHLSRSDIDSLFGSGYQLAPARYISEPRQFAAVETVTLFTPKAAIENVRIVGPERDFTQIELARTDCWRLGIQNAPLRASGELELVGTPGICVKSPAGEICVRQGVIVPWRHLHLNHTEALELNLDDGQMVKVRIAGERAVVLENVYVRVQADFRLSLHLDTDEANAAGVKTGTEGELVG
jgi:putative phosphotransacetylase